MQLWLFFTIFGCVLLIPTSLILLLFNRFKNTIVVLFKNNGSLQKVIIDDKLLAIGQITQINGKKVTPIKISKDEIYYGKWRRWIIKGELDSKKNSKITDREIEEYLNNEDLIKLYLAGKFKDTLLLFLTGILAAVIIGAIANGYLINTKECIISPTNSTRDFIVYSVKLALSNSASIPVGG